MKQSLFLFVPILLLSLVGCGTSPTASPPPKPTMMQVDRATHTTNQFPPLSRTITKANAVQTLYDAAMALPKVSTGPARSCPADTGLIYHLLFFSIAHSFNKWI